MVITARRDKPGSQSAALNYATPAIPGESAKAPGGASPGVGAGDTAPASGAGADDWLRRARELESAGRRKEALQAYRQASAILRSPVGAPANAQPTR